jgi:hypothetical protein
LSVNKSMLKFSGTLTGNIKINIINTSGKVIRSERSFPVNVAGIASGVYAAVLYQDAHVVDMLQFTRY